MNKRIFIIMILVAIFFTGCSEPITSERIEIAECYCSDKGGIKSIEKGSLGFFIFCKDGKYVSEKTALLEMYKTKIKD